MISFLLLSILSLAIISDSFHGTARQGFFTQILLFFSCRLLIHKRITVLIRSHEVLGRGVAADVAVDA